MSKLGRYSADRKKVEFLTAAKVVEVADCGTLFMVDMAAGAANIDLPHPTNAGKGWWCKFIVNGATCGNNATIRVLDAAGSAAVGDLIAALEVVAADEAGEQNNDADTVLIAGAAIKGTQVEVVCDGAAWYAIGHSGADAHIVVAAD